MILSSSWLIFLGNGRVAQGNFRNNSGRTDFLSPTATKVSETTWEGHHTHCLSCDPVNAVLSVRLSSKSNPCMDAVPKEGTSRYSSGLHCHSSHQASNQRTKEFQATSFNIFHMVPDDTAWILSVCSWSI